MIGLAIALVLWVVGIVALVAMGRIAVARELIALVPNMLLLFKDLLRDERVPRSAKLWLWFAAVWLASPIDLIPEFIPVLGPLDDVVVAIVALRYVRRRLGVEAMRARWTGSDDGFALLGRVVGFQGDTAEGGHEPDRVP